MPELKSIDHVHVYVPDREAAARWFSEVLGFKVIERLRSWATDGGPLTIGNDADTVHLALFERKDAPRQTNTAFGTDARNFLEWKAILEGKGVLTRITDHDLAWSLYFEDPQANMYEITTYDHAAVTKALTP